MKYDIQAAPGCITLFWIAWASSRRYLRLILITILVLICPLAHSFLRSLISLKSNFTKRNTTSNLKPQQVGRTVFWIALASSRKCLKSLLITGLILICASTHPFPQITDQLQRSMTSKLQYMGMIGLGIAWASFRRFKSINVLCSKRLRWDEVVRKVTTQICRNTNDYSYMVQVHASLRDGKLGWHLNEDIHSIENNFHSLDRKIQWASTESCSTPSNR